MKNISVIGAGTMGNGIAHVFAQKGYQVNLIDISSEALEKALSTIERNLNRMVRKELLEESQVASILANISTNTDLSDGVKEADLVVEAATENEDIKLKIFEQMDAAAPTNAILASNTSSISITKIATATSRPD